MMSNNSSKNHYKQWLKLMLVHICNKSYKIFRLIFQTTHILLLYMYIYIYIYIYILYIYINKYIYIYIYIYLCVCVFVWGYMLKTKSRQVVVGRQLLFLSLFFYYCSSRSRYKNKVCILCWCPCGRCVINGLEWQHGFELFLQFAIIVSQ